MPETFGIGVNRILWMHAYFPSRARLYSEFGRVDTLSANSPSKVLPLHPPITSIELEQDPYRDSHLVLFDGNAHYTDLPFVGHTHLNSLVTESAHPSVPMNPQEPSDNLIMFQRFGGRFMQFYNPKGSDRQSLRRAIADPDALARHRWNGPHSVMGYRYPSAAMLIKAAHRSEFRWHSGQAFGLVWDEIVKMVVGGAFFVEPVVLAWLPHPRPASLTTLEEGAQYMVLHQRFTVLIPFPVYRWVPCALNAYFEPKEEDGKFVMAYRDEDIFVETGWGSHLIVNALQPVRTKWGEIMSTAAGIFNFFSDIPAESVSILPGSQTARLSGDVNYGDAQGDGFTLVITPPDSGDDKVEDATQQSDIVDTLNQIGNGLQTVFNSLDGINTSFNPIVVSGSGNVIENHVHTHQYVNGASGLSGAEPNYE